MSKFFSFLIIGLLALGTIAAVHRNTPPARVQADFIPVSVLAENEADYGVDEGLYMIPSISLEIIADKLQDQGQAISSLPVILFTSDEKTDDKKDEPDREENTPDQPTDEKDKDNNGNDNGNGNENGNGNGQEKDKDNKGNGKDKGKQKEQENQKGGNGKGTP